MTGRPRERPPPKTRTTNGGLACPRGLVEAGLSRVRRPRRHTHEPEPRQTNEPGPFLTIGEVGVYALGKDRFRIVWPGGEREVEARAPQTAVLATPSNYVEDSRHSATALPPSAWACSVYRLPLES